VENLGAHVVVFKQHQAVETLHISPAAFYRNPDIIFREEPVIAI
jgi:hypothetical protein